MSRNHLNLGLGLSSPVLDGPLSPSLGTTRPSPRTPDPRFNRKRSTDLSSSPLLGHMAPRSPALSTSRRSLYDANQGVISGVRRLAGALVRPLYVLSRRGPLYPMLALVFMLFFFTLSSTSTASQSVKRRVQGVVGPYIPQRAANAINWRSPQATWSRGEELKKGDAAAARAGVVGGGANRDTSPVLKSAFETAAEPRRDGRTLIEMGKEHPIPALMRDAKVKWAALQGRQSTSFAEAVNEYKRRYGRAPPKGYDQW